MYLFTYLLQIIPLKKTASGPVAALLFPKDRCCVPPESEKLQRKPPFCPKNYFKPAHSGPQVCTGPHIAGSAGRW